MKYLLLLLTLLLPMSLACGKKPADELECEEGEIARGGKCIEKPQIIKCEAPQVRRGSQCLSPREQYCANWATNFPECNACPEGYTFELNRCRCADAACYDQAQCADPGEGAGRRILLVDSMAESFIMDAYGVNLKPSIAEIKQNTGVEVVHKQLGSKGDMEDAIDQVKNEEWDAIWMLDGNVPDYPWADLGAAIKDKIAKGVGLGALTDNEPFLTGVELALNTAKPDWAIDIAGDYKGEGFVSLEGYESMGSGKLHEHEMTIGLYEKVSEGVTISHIEGGTITASPNYKVVLTNTEGKTGVVGVEEEIADQAAGYARAVKNIPGKVVQRTAIHTGFTALYQHSDPKAHSWTWNSEASPGTPLFWYNMACWTANVK